MKYSLIYQFFGGHYHQDVWEDFETDQDIWNDFKSRITDEKRKLIIIEIENILQENDQSIMTLIEDMTYFGGIDFDSSNEAKEFLNNFKNFLLRD